MSDRSSTDSRSSFGDHGDRCSLPATSVAQAWCMDASPAMLTARLAATTRKSPAPPPSHSSPYGTSGRHGYGPPGVAPHCYPPHCRSRHAGIATLLAVEPPMHEHSHAVAMLYNAPTMLPGVHSPATPMVAVRPVVGRPPILRSPRSISQASHPDMAGPRSVSASSQAVAMKTKTLERQSLDLLGMHVSAAQEPGSGCASPVECYRSQGNHYPGPMTMPMTPSSASSPASSPSVQPVFNKRHAGDDRLLPLGDRELDSISSMEPPLPRKRTASQMEEAWSPTGTIFSSPHSKRFRPAGPSGNPSDRLTSSAVSRSSALNLARRYSLPEAESARLMLRPVGVGITRRALSTGDRPVECAIVPDNANARRASLPLNVLPQQRNNTQRSSEHLSLADLLASRSVQLPQLEQATMRHSLSPSSSHPVSSRSLERPLSALSGTSSPLPAIIGKPVSTVAPQLGVSCAPDHFLYMQSVKCSSATQCMATAANRALASSRTSRSDVPSSNPAPMNLGYLGTLLSAKPNSSGRPVPAISSTAATRGPGGLVAAAAASPVPTVIDLLSGADLLDTSSASAGFTRGPSSISPPSTTEHSTSGDAFLKGSSSLRTGAATSPTPMCLMSQSVCSISSDSAASGASFADLDSATAALPGCMSVRSTTSVSSAPLARGGATRSSSANHGVAVMATPGIHPLVTTTEHGCSADSAETGNATGFREQHRRDYTLQRRPGEPVASRVHSTDGNDVAGCGRDATAMETTAQSTALCSKSNGLSNSGDGVLASARTCTSAPVAVVAAASSTSMSEVSDCSPDSDTDTVQVPGSEWNSGNGTLGNVAGAALNSLTSSPDAFDKECSALLPMLRKDIEKACSASSSKDNFHVDSFSPDLHSNELLAELPTFLSQQSPINVPLAEAFVTTKSTNPSTGGDDMAPAGSSLNIRMESDTCSQTSLSSEESASSIGPCVDPNLVSPVEHRRQRQLSSASASACLPPAAGRAATPTSRVKDNSVASPTISSPPWSTHSSRSARSCQSRSFTLRLQKMKVCIRNNKLSPLRLTSPAKSRHACPSTPAKPGSGHLGTPEKLSYLEPGSPVKSSPVQSSNVEPGSRAMPSPAQPNTLTDLSSEQHVAATSSPVQAATPIKSAAASTPGCVTASPSDRGSVATSPAHSCTSSPRTTCAGMSTDTLISRTPPPLQDDIPMATTAEAMSDEVLDIQPIASPTSNSSAVRDVRPVDTTPATAGTQARRDQLDSPLLGDVGGDVGTDNTTVDSCSVTDSICDVRPTDVTAETTAEVAMDEQAMDEQAMDEQAMDEQAMDEQAMDEQAMDEQAMGIEAASPASATMKSNSSDLLQLEPAQPVNVQAASTVATDSSSMATDASTVAVDSSTMVTDSSTVATDVSTVAMDSSTMVTDSNTVATDSSTVATDPSTVATDISTVATESSFVADTSHDIPLTEVTSKETMNVQTASATRGSKAVVSTATRSASPASCSSVPLSQKEAAPRHCQKEAAPRHCQKEAAPRHCLSDLFSATSTSTFSPVVLTSSSAHTSTTSSRSANQICDTSNPVFAAAGKKTSCADHSPLSATRPGFRGNASCKIAEPIPITAAPLSATRPGFRGNASCKIAEPIPITAAPLSLPITLFSPRSLSSLRSPKRSRHSAFSSTSSPFKPVAAHDKSPAHGKSPSKSPCRTSTTAGDLNAAILTGVFASFERALGKRQDQLSRDPTLLLRSAQQLDELCMAEKALCQQVQELLHSEASSQQLQSAWEKLTELMAKRQGQLDAHKRVVFSLDARAQIIDSELKSFVRQLKTWTKENTTGKSPPSSSGSLKTPNTSNASSHTSSTGTMSQTSARASSARGKTAAATSSDPKQPVKFYYQPTHGTTQAPMSVLNRIPRGFRKIAPMAPSSASSALLAKPTTTAENGKSAVIAKPATSVGGGQTPAIAQSVSLAAKGTGSSVSLAAKGTGSSVIGSATAASGKSSVAANPVSSVTNGTSLVMANPASSLASWKSPVASVALTTSGAEKTAVTVKPVLTPAVASDVTSDVTSDVASGVAGAVTTTASVSPANKSCRRTPPTSLPQTPHKRLVPIDLLRSPLNIANAYSTSDPNAALPSATLQVQLETDNVEDAVRIISMHGLTGSASLPWRLVPAAYIQLSHFQGNLGLEDVVAQLTENSAGQRTVLKADQTVHCLICKASFSTLWYSCNIPSTFLCHTCFSSTRSLQQRKLRRKLVQEELAKKKPAPQKPGRVNSKPAKRTKPM